ncbi:GRF zinc finger domain-containing protein [Cercophora scortea]|uniref:GRF zinc finger domain-containing protein n=1 Tax=Cercophora scortea TaxID=314031 RepID=A0AAE0IEE7_9PEZI|nr:GRF zinc finger domain-containing protein [Cercophora scortea]
MMDGFVTSKKRKAKQVVGDDGDDEPTDVKLAILSSLHPAIDQETLLECLLAHDGSVQATSGSLKTETAGLTGRSPRKAPSSQVHSQSSLRSWSTPASTSKRAKLLSRKGATLHLFDPEDIAAHTPCTVIHNFLPSDEANLLLVELLQEAQTFEKITFKLFDHVVSSPHTSAFYVETDQELDQQTSEYVYNGGKLTDVRKITPQLLKVKTRVQEAVNREIQERIRTHQGGKKLKYQSPHPWSPNVAFVNCYSGAEESVGWHSDQLTYLGPRAVIGSLSLGVAREFRVRRILPKETDDDNSSNKNNNSNPDAQGQIAIHLPHNSLLVMHAEMQEEWKHSIAPASVIDPHPVAGARRINVTYRDYRDAFHPRHTPRCSCGVATVLRVVQRKKGNWGRYFWMCHAGNVPGKQGCTFFQWAEFDDDGNPATSRPGQQQQAKE